MEVWGRLESETVRVAHDGVVMVAGAGWWPWEWREMARHTCGQLLKGWVASGEPPGLFDLVSDSGERSRP